MGGTGDGVALPIVPLECRLARLTGDGRGEDGRVNLLDRSRGETLLSGTDDVGRTNTATQLPKGSKNCLSKIGPWRICTISSLSNCVYQQTIQYQ
jgi:hypothetical protein